MAWETPVELPDGHQFKKLKIPTHSTNPAISGDIYTIVCGALYELSQPENWQNVVGNVDAEDIAAIFSGVFNDFLNEPFTET